MTLAVGIGFVCFDLVDKLSKDTDDKLPNHVATQRGELPTAYAARSAKDRAREFSHDTLAEYGYSVHADTPDSTTSTNQHLALRQKKSLSR